MPSSRRSRAFHCLVFLVSAAALCACSRRAQRTPAARSAEERCDDHGWCTQTPAGLGKAEDTLTAVWAGGSNDVWAVGLSGALWHWDGARWLSRPSGLRILRGVFGFGPRVWLVGDETVLVGDGKQFETYNLAMRGELHGVFGTSADDVWVVADAGSTAHWDGHRFTRVDAPFHGWLLAVWGSSPNDYWAAGGEPEGEKSNAILHWNGLAWSVEPLPRSCTIEALSGTARDDIWAVGSWGTILHYGGKHWTNVPSPASRGLNGVWARARDDVWAVGENGMVLHYDGKQWKSAKPDWKWLRAVSGTSSRELWGVGQAGWILHWHSDKLQLEPASSAASPFVTRPPPPTAVAAATASASASANTASPSPPDPDAMAALARARKLLADGKADAAQAEFIRAIGSGPNLNKRPLVELAYMQLLKNKGAEEDEDIEADLLIGVTDGDPELEAQAWYNLALLYARQNRQELERAALARSLARRDHPTVKAKLQGRSRCVAQIGGGAGHEPSIVRGWSGVCGYLGTCEKGKPVKEAEARRLSCLTCSMSAQAPDESHGCEGDGPWDSSFDYMTYSENKAWIAPLDSGRFFVVMDREGAWPAICRGSASMSWEKTGTYATETLTDSGMWPAPGHLVPQGDPENGACVEGIEATTTAIYDLKTAKLLAQVSVVQGHPVVVHLDDAARRLTLSGGGCDGYLRLDGSMRLIAQ